MNTIQDQQQRQEALNPSKSFIVQAPAGSGKTELLTQRFLGLLSHVKQPEEILAITFTKKSAAEMRARIINALRNASQAPEPEAAHAKTTWKLAKNALKQNQTLGWNLLENPNRLRIQTIDSFNAYLTKQLPILSHFGAPPEIADDPTDLYRSAVQEFLMYLEEETDWTEAIVQLLLHVDNDLNKLETLLINLLKKRDQWLPYITLNANDPNIRSKLEGYLSSVVTDALLQLNRLFPKEYISELTNLADFAAHNLAAENSSSVIIHCKNISALPANKEAWLGLAELLLTKDFQWRKQYTKSQGFLAPSNSKNSREKALFDSMKQRMLSLIEALQQYPALIPAFSELKLSPDCQYQENQWRMLDALHQVLRIVVAQLKLVFQQRGKIDYIECAQAALTALGTDEMPTDMVLALDYQLQHILIDEFQDTSNSQFRLIEKLTAGWEPHDGRTLFVVGDPMQSIYRFREAEVGYFIRARQHGINHIDLEPLTLSVNFRSTPGIVAWVNQHFQTILPAFEDIATGAVSYSPSVASQENINTQAVALHPFFNTIDDTQAIDIVQLIQKIKQENPSESIVILVRSRTHLTSIIPALKSAKLPFKAIDIDPLSSCPVIQDLIVLTRALLHPADRIAWLAVLRAPWCGLTLNDLLTLVNSDLNAPIWTQLQSASIIEKLSAEGQQRINRILPILRVKIADRSRYSLRTWLESTWLLLGGPACTQQASDLTDAAAYFQLLEKLDKSGGLPNFEELERAVNQLYAVPDNQADNTLQIMTIHNAKGLEFDTVIIPHLERKSPNDDKQLLLWMERPRSQEQNALLIAPIHAVGQANDSIYDYIKRQHAIKNDYESGRLLYVAATRAKKRLHLFFSLQSNQDKITKPALNSLLDKLWNSISSEISKQPILTPATDVIATSSSSNDHHISRLTLNWVNPITEIYQDNIAYHQKKLGFQLPNNYYKNIGIVTHQLLQHISLHSPSWWQQKSQEMKISYIQNQLKQLGMLSHQLEAAITSVETAILNTLQDTRGQWILKAHQEAKTELQLTAMIENKIKSLAIDRTFVDENGIRWIIDYKTSTFAGENLEEFLNTEQTKYAQQLRHYTAAIQAIDQRPIKLGLYFPALPAWREWEVTETA